MDDVSEVVLRRLRSSPRQGHTDSVVDAASSAGRWGELLHSRLLCKLRQQLATAAVRFSHGLEVAFSTDGVYAATGSYDGTVRRKELALEGELGQQRLQRVKDG